MGTTHLSGPLKTGTKFAGEDGANQGYAVLQQSVALAQDGTNDVSATVYVPAGSRLIDIVVDVLTAFDSATSAVLSVGTAAAGTQYAGSVDVKAATGRIRPTFTAAQLAAMSNVSVLGVEALTPAPVVFTITPTGATTAGYVQATLIYAQLD